MAQVRMAKLNRKVIIIKGFSKDDEELAQDRLYVEYYKKFFNHTAGGAYEDGEIEIFEEISTECLKSYFEDKPFDFVVVVLLGHGATQRDYQLFQLNQVEIVQPGQLEINSDKQLIILESCRDIRSGIPAVDLSDKIPSYKKGGKFCRPISRQRARCLYDKQIRSCEKGQVICFACSKDESAYGYYFSKSLIQSAFDWHSRIRNHEAILIIQDIMTVITPIVNGLVTKNSNNTKLQNPQIIGNIEFPFATSKF